MKFKHISVTEEQYWRIKRRMAKLKIDKFYNFVDLLLELEDKL